MLSPEIMANFIISLKIMGMGMAGIFTVVLVIMMIVTILTKVTKPKEQDSNN